MAFKRRSDLVAHVGEKFALSAFGLLRGLFLFLQGKLGLFLLRNVNHDPAHLHRAALLEDHADVVAHPEDTVICREHPVLGLHVFFLASVHVAITGNFREIFGVENALPKAGFALPASGGMAGKAFRLAAHEAEAGLAHVGFPHDTVDGVHELFEALAG